MEEAALKLFILQFYYKRQGRFKPNNKAKSFIGEKDKVEKVN